MPIINPNFKKNKKVYLFKCFVALIAMIFVLLSLQLVASNIVLGAIGASSLASSIFVAFAMPDSAAAHPKRMVGSYAISIVLGIVCYYFGTYLLIMQNILSFSLTYELVGALAVTATMLCMILFSFEHPPATGLALGLVIEPWQGWTILIIILAIIGIATIKTLVSPWLLSDSPHEE
ncbi:MAG: hypothetical protein CMF49_09915 [Legionellales bacterium]|nr:hypothetical protein [Legionellales bacterium]|tara:strand:+ start:71 stop:601 length:531 start_codon:yes stop_codon:yes gene_type:complete